MKNNMNNKNSRCNSSRSKINNKNNISISSGDGDKNEFTDNSEIEWDNNNTNETLGTIMKEITDSKKRRLSSSNDLSNDYHSQKVLKSSANNNNNSNSPEARRSNTSRQQVHSSNSPNASSNKKKIEPVIFFKVHENPDKNKIEQYLISKVKDVKIEEFKITANNNVLIYTNSNEANEALVNNANLFQGISRLNLNNIDKRPYLILKSVAYDFIKYKIDELKQIGIVEVIEMKSKTTNKSFNFVKALVENEEKKQALLNERFIRIGLSKIYLEEFIRPPVQCRQCKRFGHIEKFCKFKYKCAKCGEEHQEDSCQVGQDNQKCVNCNGNHSTYYRGCSEYREAKNLKLFKNKIHTTPNQVQHTEFKRTYSSAVASNSSDELLKKFESMLISNNAIIKEQTKTIVKEESTAIIDRINFIMKQNNTNLCYFIIQTIKTLVPSVKFDSTKMSHIEKAFNDYKLGDIKSDKLNEHFCRNVNSDENRDTFGND